MLKLIRYLKGYAVKTVLGPFLKLIEAAFELTVPLIVASMIDKGIPLAQNGDWSYITYGGIIIVILGMLGLCSALTAQFFASRASLGFGTNLRRDLYSHINTFSAAELDKFSASSLVTRLTVDINQAQQAVGMFIRLIMRAPFIVLGSCIMAMILDLKMSAIFIVAALIIAVVPISVISSTMPKYKKIQKKLDDISLKTRENLSGARVIRAFCAEKREKESFEQETTLFNKMTLRVNAVSAIMNPLTYALINLAVIAVLYFGAVNVNIGELTQGKVIALVNYLTQILNSLLVLANLIVIFTKASASASRINEVFAVKTSMEEGSGAQPAEGSPAAELKGVSFTYPGASSPALKNINLTVEKSETVGILGGTGSGKSSLVNLICRQYDTTEGEVKILGNDIRKYSYPQLKSIMGVAPQQAAVFAGTVRDNMKIGKEDATDEEIETALSVAQAKAFLDQKQGLDTIVEQGGKNFSGGQKQRLTVARAVIGSPKILIFDDSSSALDFKTESALRKALSRFSDKAAVITVSQRAASVMHCQKIVVMDDGKIAGEGTHTALMESCPAYREIYLSQNKNGEAAL